MNAFLIICHKNPKQVIRFAKKCKTQNTDIFIHADTHMHNNQYKELQTLSKKENFILTEKRIHGQLDHRSLVDIAMILIETAINYGKKNNKHYYYFALLSGQDYLIKPMSYIENKLNILYPKPLIDCTPYSKNNWVSHKFSKNYNLLLFREWIENNFSNKKSFFYKTFRGIGFVWRKCLQITHKSDYYYCKKKKIKLYGGSAWWILPDKIIHYILYTYNNETFVKKLLETYTPEETFFQIMTMRTKYSRLVDLNPVDSVEQSCKTYAYFSDKNKPFCGHPYIITTKNKEMISGLSNYWIARKFDITVDDKILDFIDKNLNMKEG